MVYADQMFKEILGDPAQKAEDEEEGGPGEQFPIEFAEKKLFFRTTLQHRNKDEINMYNCPVRFGELTDDWPVKALLLAPDTDQVEGEEGPSMEDAQEALAHTAGIVLNYLIDQNIPHNILIADEGMTMYIIPRKFDMLIENCTFLTSFETLCGFVKFKHQSSYASSDFQTVKTQLEQSVSLSATDFDRMKTELVAKFMKEYEGKTIQ